MAITHLILVGSLKFQHIWFQGENLHWFLPKKTWQVTIWRKSIIKSFFEETKFLTKQIYFKLKHIPFQYIRTETFQLQHSLKPLRPKSIVNCTTFLLTCKHPPSPPHMRQSDRYRCNCWWAVCFHGATYWHLSASNCATFIVVFR